MDDTLWPAGWRLASVEQPETKQRRKSSAPPAGGLYISFPLSNGNAVEIRLRERVTPKDFERIKTLVELSEASLVETSNDELACRPA